MIESLVALLIASLLVSLMFAIQMACIRQWHKQESLTDWQENQRLGYWLFRTWLKDLKALSDADFKLEIISLEQAKYFFKTQDTPFSFAAKPESPLLFAIANHNFHSMWFIGADGSLFLKEKGGEAQAVLSQLEGWQLTLLEKKDNSSYLLQVTLDWSHPLRSKHSIPFYYHY